MRNYAKEEQLANPLPPTDGRSGHFFTDSYLHHLKALEDNDQAEFLRQRRDRREKREGVLLLIFCLIALACFAFMLWEVF